MNQTAAADARRSILAGILLTSMAYALFSVQDASIKLLVVGFSVWQLLLTRSVVILLGCVAVGGRPLLAATTRSAIWKPMFVRSLCLFAAWFCFYRAARDLPLAELTTIYFAAPIMITLMAVPLLGEKVPPARWAAVLLGFAGVFVACGPAALRFSPPVLLVLAAAFFWGLSNVLLRKTAADEKATVQMVISNFYALVVAGAAAPFVWVTPDGGQLALMLFAGIVAGFGQLLLFEGIKRAPVSIIAPFEYTSLIWAFLLGYAIWHDVPRPAVFFGAALIIGAGLIILVGERFGRPASPTTL